MPYIFILPSAIGTLLLTVVPFVSVIYTSFCTSTAKLMSGNNYIMVLSNPAFKLAIKNSYIFSFFSVTTLYIVSIVLTAILLFCVKEKLVRKVNMASTIPSIFPITMIVLFERILFDKYGMINGLLDSKQLKTVNWLESKPILIILIISFIGKNIGLAIILWGAGIKNIPESMVEASRLDGANKRQCFFNIILPNLNRTKYLVLLYFLIQSFKGFREMYLISGEYPYESVYFLQNIFNNWFRDMELDLLAAGAVLNAGILLIIMYLMRKIIYK